MNGFLPHLLLTAMVVYLMQWMFGLLKEKLKPNKIIWVIEDNPIDIELFKLRAIADGYEYRFFNSAKGIIGPLTTSTPDGVIVDYMLGMSVKGDEIFNICKNNKIKCLMLTGYEDEIFGIDRKHIVKKQQDLSHMSKVNQWLVDLFKEPSSC